MHFTDGCEHVRRKSHFLVSNSTERLKMGLNNSIWALPVSPVCGIEDFEAKIGREVRKNPPPPFKPRLPFSASPHLRTILYTRPSRGERVTKMKLRPPRSLAARGGEGDTWTTAAQDSMVAMMPLPQGTELTVSPLC